LFILVALPGLAADLAFDLPSFPVSLNIAGQPVAITISGEIYAAPAKPGDSEQPFAVNLHADLADLQSHMTPLLQTELNQSNRCGERISVETATLVPAAPAGNLAVQLHFEKWACLKAFGKENAKRLLSGDGTVNVLLTPQVAEDGNTVRLDAQIGNIEADGSVGDLLHSEFGAALMPQLRDKIREALLKAIQKAAMLDAVVPERARPFVKIQSVAFAERGTGILQLNLTGRLQVPADQLSSILAQLQSRK
jgi:hypothetical protein